MWSEDNGMDNRVLMGGWSAQTHLNMAEDAVMRAYLELKRVP